MLIYALLHLTGYKAMTIEELKHFRKLNSKTPGHPENFITEGVETTTGPLGQGIANAVGMAIAERHLAATFGDVVDHRTYVLCSDGDLMEGISQEAIALAGHLKLNRLVVLFDDNGITIDGKLSLSDSVDQVKRFESAGWIAERIDGHDPEAIAAAIAKAQKADRPTHDRLQDHHRFRRTEQGRQREVARLAARRRRDRRRAQGARLGARAVPCAGRHSESCGSTLASVRMMRARRGRRSSLRSLPR